MQRFIYSKGRVRVREGKNAGEGREKRGKEKRETERYLSYVGSLPK